MAYSEGEAVFFTKSGSLARVWAAFCERSYEGIATNAMRRKADVRRYDKIPGYCLEDGARRLLAMRRGGDEGKQNRHLCVSTNGD